MAIAVPSRVAIAALVLAVGCAGAPLALAQCRPAASVVAADPVADAVAEASRRFGVPEHWIRAVMRVESAGDRNAVSRAGAMGLMQVMPATYAELRRQLDLGPNPFDIRDNILAGAAYLRQMYDRYGAPGFLAAYNAGPGRWESHLAGRRALPSETVNYLARLAPELGLSAGSDLVAAPPAPALSPFEAPLFVQTSAHSAAEPPLPDAQRTDAIATDRTRAVQNDRRSSAQNGIAPRTEIEPPSASIDDGDVAAIVARPAPLPAGSALFVPRTGTRTYQQ
jgi:hypothetical protein